MLWHRLLQEPTASLPSSAFLVWRTCLHTAKGSGVLTKPNLVPCLENTKASRHERSKKGLSWCQEERRRKKIKLLPGVQKVQPSPQQRWRREEKCLLKLRGDSR